MENKTLDKTSLYYSAWYGIISAVLALLFFALSAFPILRLDVLIEGKSAIFSINHLSLMVGFGVKFGDPAVIHTITKFSLLNMIPFLLILASTVFFLASKLSAILGFLGSLCLIGAGFFVTQIANPGFYADAVQAAYISSLLNSTVVRELGYYLSFSYLFLIGFLSIVLMIVMRVKGRRAFKNSKAVSSTVGIASHYRNKIKKTKN